MFTIKWGLSIGVTPRGGVESIPEVGREEPISFLHQVSRPLECLHLHKIFREKSVVVTQVDHQASTTPSLRDEKTMSLRDLSGGGSLLPTAFLRQTGQLVVEENELLRSGVYEGNAMVESRRRSPMSKRQTNTVADPIQNCPARENIFPCSPFSAHVVTQTVGEGLARIDPPGNLINPRTLRL